ncbi:interleukin enhancer-binding factor 2-like protein [Dinothrombium tinctorium]|uniref:Interleukin enhancer-binding factor 2-like protein n=1 Tax=Dinothrombium tinctorium TaxID=1965070 RepID=A0A443RKA1_9ACAR|nr:interleukin enhancer-binding factor 2-like protein [Dinothrombium tinctorium]
MYEKVRRNNRGNYQRTQYHSYPRPPFDIYMVEDFFPKVNPTNDLDSLLTQAILKRNADLTPSPEEQTNLVNLVSKVQIVIENITLTPGNFDACQIEEVRPVGSFKKGTMLTGRNIADLVVILKTLPIVEAIKSLGTKVVEELTKMDPTYFVKMQTIDGGFDVISNTNGAVVRVLITTIMPNMRKIDPTIHLPVKMLQKHMSAIRHVRWFEESANLTTVKVLIRVLRDVCARFEGLQALTPWMIDVLSHYSVTFRHSQQLLPLNNAFKRVLQLLAGGLFLPGSTGIPDPCENGAITMHTPLSLMQQDAVCMTAQTLLRIMSYGNGYRVILGLDPDPFNIAVNMSFWDDVVVAPSNAAFELPPKDEEMEADIIEPEPEDQSNIESMSIEKIEKAEKADETKAKS